MVFLTGPMGWAFRALILVTGTFLVLWTWSALSPREPSLQALRFFDRQYLDLAAERARKQYVAWALRNGLVFGVAFLLVRSGWIARVTEHLVKVRSPQGHVAAWSAFLAGSVASLLWLIVTSLVALPLRYYAEHHLERLYGLSRMTTGQWFLDYAKTMLVTAVVTGLCGGVLLLLMRMFPRQWPYLAGAGVLILSLAVSYLYPVLVAPMFYRFRPLEDPGLMADVHELADKAGIPVSRVLVMEASAKTGRLNAYFTGLGRTKQVVLYDTLLSEVTRTQARLVLAHEMSHYRRGHILKGIILSSVAVLVFFLFFAWASGRAPLPAGDSPGAWSLERTVSGLVVLLLFLSLLEFAGAPVTNWISRRFELQADLDSLAWTQDPQAFAESHVKLARGNLSDVEPPPFIRWFAWTHPTTLERLALASPLPE